MGAPHISQSGKYFKAQACGAARVTAAGAGDNTAITGSTIDTRGYGSAKFVIAYKTTLASSETLKFAAEYQESDDGSAWDTAVAIQAATTAQTGVQTAKVGEVAFDVQFGTGGTATASKTGGKRYCRFNFTPDLSASGTDTADVSATAMLGGAEVRPAA